MARVLKKLPEKWSREDAQAWLQHFKEEERL